MLSATISWSGGKDSAFALYKILSDARYDVAGIHTLIDETTGRVGLHGVREEIIDAQAKSLGLPLTKLYTSVRAGQSNYEDVTKGIYKTCTAEGIDCVVFGDIFLEDLRSYRERLLEDFKLTPIFPLWKIDSCEIYNQFVDAGFKAAICSADAELFNKEHLGITLDRSTPAKFKKEIDVCGENGEYHTLVYDGPILKKPLLIQRGEVTKKWYDYKVKNASGEIEVIKTPFFFQEFFLLSAW